MNIGIIGAGYWGKNLVRVFHQLGHLYLVCDKDKDMLKKYEKEYPGLNITTDIDSIFEDDKIEAVVIAAPAVLHYELAKKAILKKKHVFVEKPLALEVDQAEELIALSKENGVVLMVGHILQYHNAVIKLKEIIDNGELGKI